MIHRLTAAMCVRSVSSRRLVGVPTFAPALLVIVSGCAATARPTVLPEPGGPMRVVHDSIARVLDRAIADSAFPGAISVVGTRDGTITSYAVGRIDWPANAPAPDENTMWDIASLTKVVGMTTAMMQLVEQDRVELDAPVARYLPEFVGEGKERVTVRHLLTHSSGLPAWRALYKEASNADPALALVFQTPLDTVPGARMMYSDLGAILLGKIVERVSGEPLDVYIARHITRPLGMTATTYRPDTSLRPRIAPTEFDPWRQRHIRGEVHDENAYMLGGGSGHAGLFSTAADLTRFARMMLGGGTLDGARIVRASTIAQFTAGEDPPPF